MQGNNFLIVSTFKHNGLPHRIAPTARGQVIICRSENKSFRQFSMLKEVFTTIAAADYLSQYRFKYNPGN